MCLNTRGKTQVLKSLKACALPLPLGCEQGLIPALAVARSVQQPAWH